MRSATSRSQSSAGASRARTSWIVAGDNLIGYSLADFADFWRAKGGSALAVHEVADRSLLRNYGVVQLDEDERVDRASRRSLPRPKGDLAATASYLYRGDHLALLPATSRRAILQTLRATSWPGCTPASPSTATGRPANGTTSATSASCWPRTTCSGSERGSRPGNVTTCRRRTLWVLARLTRCSGGWFHARNDRTKGTADARAATDHPSPTSVAVAAAHDAPLTAALDRRAPKGDANSPSPLSCGLDLA